MIQDSTKWQELSKMDLFKFKESTLMGRQKSLKELSMEKIWLGKFFILIILLENSLFKNYSLNSLLLTIVKIIFQLVPQSTAGSLLLKINQHTSNNIKLLNKEQLTLFTGPLLSIIGLLCKEWIQMTNLIITIKE